MSDPRNRYVVDFTALMATHQDGKVRVGQAIGSQSGARFVALGHPYLYDLHQGKGTMDESKNQRLPCKSPKLLAPALPNQSPRNVPSSRL
jgi:hypothetical protein